MACKIFDEHIALLLRTGRILNISFERLVNNIARRRHEEQSENTE
jgi:hypothetical protein